jgi:hypothetical protein
MLLGLSPGRVGLSIGAISAWRIVGYDVFVLAGQSNMIGRYGPIDGALDATDSDIQMYGFDGQAVALAQDPLDHQDETANTVGMGLSFAKAYRAAGLLGARRKILLVPTAKGGTGFDAQWGSGLPSDVATITRVNAAMATNSGNQLKGILWHQGETDNGKTESAYAALLDALISRWRAGMTGATSATPFVCGGLLVGGSFTGTGVSAALAATPARVANTGYAPSTSLVSGGDNLHFSAASQRTFGGRYFTAWQSALTSVPPAGTNLLASPRAFDAWTTANISVTANVANDPVSGTATADRLADNSTNAAHNVISPAAGSGAVTNGLTYTLAIDAKMETHRYVQIFGPSAQWTLNAFANFDLQTGTVGTVGSAATASIFDLGDGWYRCAITMPCVGSASTIIAVVGLASSASATRANVYSGSGTALLVANAQLVSGTVANAY